MQFAIQKPEALRRGQQDAIRMIEQRVRRGEDTTAIVLPCRYGKSDVARLAAMKMWAEGTCCTSLALSPAETLRDQLGDPARWERAIKRFGIRVKTSPRIATIDKAKAGIRCRFNPNGEAFLSVTVQLAVLNLNLFRDWVADEFRRTGLRVVIFVDECHTGSSSNEWGSMVPVLVRAGAHIVLLTATPERADGEQIQGFAFDEVEEGDLTVHKSRPHATDPDKITVEKLQGIRKKLQLRPDYEVTFREAWGEDRGDNPPILCKISLTSLDVKLSEAGVQDSATWLSELSEDRAGEVLGKLTRSSVVIRDGCSRLLEALDARRDLNPGFQAMIFCGNDTEQGGDRNAHISQIERELNSQRAGLDIRIATSADDGKDVLGKFMGTEDSPGHGDVLLVKQQAGMGLDLPWVKVALDLSATRAYPSYVQRLCRCATPCSGAIACEWITPADRRAKAHFDRLVTQQGGEAHASDLALVDSWDKQRKDITPSPELIIEDTRVGGFSDSLGGAADPQQWQTVADLIQQFPRITSVHTHAELAEMEAAKLNEAAAQPPDDNHPLVEDTSIRTAALRAEMTMLAKQLTRISLQRSHIASTYPETIKQIWNTAKEDAGWSLGTSVDATNDLGELQALHDALTRMMP